MQSSNRKDVEQDETAYLLANPVNKQHLLDAITKVNNQQLIDVDIAS
jgi:hypothetical protein